MKDHIVAVRAVAGVYAQSILLPALLWGVLIFALLIALVVYLANQLSGWWGLLLVPIIPLGIFFVLFWVIAWHVTRQFIPAMNKIQQQAVRAFVSKVQVVAENLQMHFFVIVFYVIRDTLLRRQDGFVYGLVNDSVSLKEDFVTLARLFNQPKL